VSSFHNQRYRPSRAQRQQILFGEQGFRCVQCGQLVSCAPAIAGVQNRNHCPACLWSRHLDWRAAGDRQSTCRAPMQPVGLTTKRSRNRYARERDGELMIVHRCTGCGAIVINRIAADDSTAAILEVFERSCDSRELAATLDRSGVAPLTTHDRDLVRRRLFGNGAASVAIAPAWAD
jgi:hypothetical protein